MKKQHHATIQTNKWPIRVILYHEEVPHTVANFIALSNNKFYDGLSFHRVIDDFMIQAWCPHWDGTGWPWYHFPDEFHPSLKHSWPGVLSMANSWPNTNGSQFFITHIETPRLDARHSVFGKIVDETDLIVVNSIVQWDTIETIEIHDIPKLPEQAEKFMEEINQFLQSRTN